MADPTRFSVPLHLDKLQLRASDQRRMIEQASAHLKAAIEGRGALIADVRTAIATVGLRHVDWSDVLKDWALVDLSASTDVLFDLHALLDDTLEA